MGVIGGIPVTLALPGYSSDNPYLETGRWTVGPAVEFHLIVVGSNVFLSPGTSTLIFMPPGSSPLFETYRSRTKAWDFPLLPKYRFHGDRFAPFVEADYSFTHESTDANESFACLSGTLPCGPYVSQIPANTVNSAIKRSGPVAGAGIESHYRRLRIAPQVRYTHFDPDVNQAGVLVGLLF